MMPNPVFHPSSNFRLFIRLNFTRVLAGGLIHLSKPTEADYIDRMNAKIPVAKFKTKYLEILREVNERGKSVELTQNGKVVAVVSPPSRREPSMRAFIGSLKGTVSYQQGWDEPLGPDDWEASR